MPAHSKTPLKFIFSLVLGELIHSIATIAWINTEIILDTADANYINTLAKGEGVTGDMSTSDNGKTWTVSTIGIPEFTFGVSS